MGILIISVPLLISTSILMLGRYIGVRGGRVISILGMGIMNIISNKELYNNMKGESKIIEIKEWYNIGVNKVGIDIILDRESVIMVNLIVMVTTIVIIYSYWYMNEDAQINRFIGKLYMFAVTMLIFVTANNLYLSFLGWESVGVLSFLLINFWSSRSPENSKSALKAIIFNRIGDVFFILALILISSSNPFYTINSNPYNYQTYIVICLVLAAMAKSAQIFFHPWLGDAMAGPTPVSALLHAATMVTAGVYLIIRNKLLLLGNIPLEIIHLFLIIGSITILFAGFTAISQYDIKKIIAYSTCGQIGYMFFGLGLYLPTNGSIYHLLTHGCFKALLFLSAGLLIHSFLNLQDLRKYGYLIYQFPLTYLFFFFGSLAIIAFPFYSGFYSKELLLLHSLPLPPFYSIVLIVGSLLSSIYSFKLILYTFFTQPPLHPTHLKHSTPLKPTLYILPLIILLLASIFIGKYTSSLLAPLESINIPLEYHIHSNPDLSAKLFLLLPLIMPVLALVYIYFEFVYNKLPWLQPRLYYYNLILGSKKFFFDPIYNYLIVSPLFTVSYHFSYKFIDRGFLEYLGPLSLFRLFFLPSSLPLSQQSLNNLPNLFLYLFLSLSLLFLSFFLLSPRLL